MDVHTSSAFLAFTVLSMVFLFLTRRSYYHYYDKYYRVSSQLLQNPPKEAEWVNNLIKELEYQFKENKSECSPVLVSCSC